MIIISIREVYAIWRYSEISTTPGEKSVNVSLSVFYYPPEEVLPGGNPEDIAIGENHFALIEIILNEKDKRYWLNVNNNSVLYQYLERNGIIYSNQKVSGGNLKFVLDPKNNTHKLYYILAKESDTLYYIYTFSVDDLSTKSGSTTRILTFRTRLEKTDIKLCKC